MKPYILLVFTLLALAHAQTNYTKIYFAVNLNEGSTVPEDQEIIEAQKYAIKKFNDIVRKRYNGELLVDVAKNNTMYEIVWLQANDSADPKICLENTKNFCKNNDTADDTKFIFYSSNRNASEEAIAYLNGNCTKQIAISASGFTYKDFSDINKQRLFSVPPLLDSQLDTILPFIKFNLNHESRKDSAARVALLYSDEMYYRSVCIGLDNQEKKETYNYNISHRIAVDPNPGNFYKSAHKLLEINTNYINNTDVLIVCAPEAIGMSVLKFLKANKIDYDLVGVTPTAPAYFENKDQSYLDYVMWVDDFVPEMTYNVGDKYWFNSSADFNNLVKNETNKNANPHIYRMLYSYITAYTALEFSKTVEYEDILFAITRTSINTIVGLLSFDGFHRTNLQTNVLQTYSNATSNAFFKKIVGPPLVATAEPILPMPKYSERVYTGELSVAEYVVLAVSLAFIAISVISGFIIVIKRNNPIIHAAAPLFMLGIIAGSILVYIGAILYGFHGLSKASCILRVWFLALGFIIMFGCLFAKSFRVWRLWSANLSKTADVITDKYLVTIVGILAAIQIVFLIIYTAAGKPETRIIVKDEYRPSLNEEKCVYYDYDFKDEDKKNVGPAFIIVMVVYSFLLMGFGLFLSWRTRKVPFLAYNESRVILFSMYNVAFFCLLALIVIANAGQMPVQTEFILHSICILLSAFLTIAITVGNKFYLMSQGKNSRSKGNRSTTGGSTSSNKSDLEKSKFIPKEEYEAKLKENEQLKLQLKNLEQQQIEQLEEE